MIVTQVAAERLICPVRPAVESKSGSVTLRHKVFCLGASCMWWEWEDPAMNLPPHKESYLSKDINDPRGFCGKGHGR